MHEFVLRDEQPLTDPVSLRKHKNLFWIRTSLRGITLDSEVLHWRIFHEVPTRHQHLHPPGADSDL